MSDYDAMAAILPLLSEPIDEQVLTQLDEPLDLDDIKVRKVGGGKAPYIEGYYAIATANRVFGPDNWGYTTTEPALMVLDGGPVWVAMVTVFVRGCLPKTDIGMALPAMKRDGSTVTRESHRTAALGAVTQGLKRALRSFGPAFGLDLYDEEYRDGYFDAQRSQQHERSGGRRPRSRSQPSQGGSGKQLPDRPWDPDTLKGVILWRANRLAEDDPSWDEPPTDALSNIVSGALRGIFAEHESDKTPFTPLECIDMVCEYLFNVDFAGLSKVMMLALRKWLVGDEPGKSKKWELQDHVDLEAKAIFATMLAQSS